MKIFVVLLAILTSSLSANAFGGPKYTSSTSYKGFFSVGLGASYGSSRLLNSDGTFGSFKGQTYSLAIDMQLYNFGGSELRAYGKYSQGFSKSNEVDSDKLDRTESVFGLKLFANPNFFLLAGIGNTQQTLTRSSISYGIGHKVTALGLGYDFQLTEQWYLGVHGTYKSGAIANSGNPALTQNSFWETGELGLVMTWTPPSTTINYGK